MSRVPIVSGLAWCMLPTMAGAAFSLIGHGACLDASQHEYEFWWLPGVKAADLTYSNGDRSTCACKECEEVCSQYAWFCVGFEFYCCPDGERCISGASVLFNKGQRPSFPPPGQFSTVGYRGSPTTGGLLTGTGEISSIANPNPPDRWCYSNDEKPSTPTAYSFVGHGHCLDGAHASYEFWYISVAADLVYTRGDRSTCVCRECQEVCSRYDGCVGYDFYCCPEGERCLGGGSVLFSKGTRPSGAAPGKFSTQGPRGSATSGGDLIGSGPILSMAANTGPNGSCFSKGKVGFATAGIVEASSLPGQNISRDSSLRR